MINIKGKCSWFGGPNDAGVAPDEGLAFIYEISDQPDLFLPSQPPNTTGLARRLDPDEYYVALRWDYEQTPRDVLLNETAMVRSPKTGKAFRAYPADWGPHIDTGRIADISPGLMSDLGIKTDDEIEVIFPYEETVMLNKAVVDLSHHNSDAPKKAIDFKKMKADGVIGIIHKVTESTNYIDPAYDKHKQAARKAGLLWGAYHFLRPGDMDEQAAYFTAAIGEDIDLYVADHEDEGVSIPDLIDFCQAVEDLTGKQPVIYSGHVLKEQVSDDEWPELTRYPLWLAQYTSGTPSWPKQIWPTWWLWQYTEDGTCAGVDGVCDLNKYDGTKDELIAEWTSGKAPPRPEPEQQEVVIHIKIEAPDNVKVTIKLDD